MALISVVRPAAFWQITSEKNHSLAAPVRRRKIHDFIHLVQSLVSFLLSSPLEAAILARAA